MRGLSKIFGRQAPSAGQRSLFNFSSSTASDLAPGQREGMNVVQDQHKKELGSGGEGGNFKHMSKTGEQLWSPSSVVTGGGVGEPGQREEVNKSPVGDEIIHASADPAKAGAIDELLEEDFAAEADWRRLGNETAAGPSVFDHERPYHILHQGYHGPPPEDSHIHREDLKDSDSSYTP